MTWLQRQRSSDLGRVVAGSSGSPGPWSLNCRARRQGQRGKSSVSSACWVADDGQIDQAADDVVAEYSRLPAGRAFIDGLDGFGFDNSDVTVFCGTGDSNS